jgi:hypothetical protein
LATVNAWECLYTGGSGNLPFVAPRSISRWLGGPFVGRNSPRRTSLASGPGVGRTVGWASEPELGRLGGVSGDTGVLRNELKRSQAPGFGVGVGVEVGVVGGVLGPLGAIGDTGPFTLGVMVTPTVILAPCHSS